MIPAFLQEDIRHLELIHFDGTAVEVFGDAFAVEPDLGGVIGGGGDAEPGEVRLGEEIVELLCAEDPETEIGDGQVGGAGKLEFLEIEDCAIVLGDGPDAALGCF